MGFTIAFVFQSNFTLVLYSWKYFKYKNNITYYHTYLQNINSQQKRNYLLFSYLTRDPVAAFWTFLFTLSKVVELGDTAFIVLRKQPLIFLHWYHHITVLLYTWYSYAETSATGRWFITMNLFVHSWMYSYYALKAMGFSPPKWIAITITTLQLMQMIVGCVIVFVAYLYRQTNECNVSLYNIKFSMLMYFSYFILFARFFQQAYLSDKPGNKAKKAYANETSGNDKFKMKWNIKVLEDLLVVFKEFLEDTEMRFKKCQNNSK